MISRYCTARPVRVLYRKNIPVQYNTEQYSIVQYMHCTTHRKHAWPIDLHPHLRRVRTPTTSPTTSPTTTTRSRPTSNVDAFCIVHKYNNSMIEEFSNLRPPLAFCHSFLLFFFCFESKPRHPFPTNQIKETKTTTKSRLASTPLRMDPLHPQELLNFDCQLDL